MIISTTKFGFVFQEKLILRSLQMDKTDKKCKKNGLTKPITTLELAKDITAIDLSNKGISELTHNITLPENLYDLDLSNNNLKEVPSEVLKLTKLKTFNVSHNSITYFDDAPDFCNTIEQLNISNNALEGPPYWIWSNTPQKLRNLNLSNNPNITKSLKKEYLEELMQYSTLVTDVDVSNCRIGENIQILTLFKNTKTLNAGILDFTYRNKNNLIELPNLVLDKYINLQKLNVCNTNIFTINSNIDIHKNLIEIDLSLNNITGLPKEFCNLYNLEVCILSCNKILYLPEEFYKLEKLKVLRLDTNKLCMLPNSTKLGSLESLDLYDNDIYEVPEEIENIEKLDLAQNYFDEPTDEIYLSKRNKLRLNLVRVDGRKEEITVSESESSSLSDAEEDSYPIDNLDEDAVKQNEPPSSPEDWDSDEYWIPKFYKLSTPSTSQWLCFIKQKMEEGNFCPIDMHVTSVIDKINEERMLNPKEDHESEGQFDDYSDDNS